MLKSAAFAIKTALTARSSARTLEGFLRADALGPEALTRLSVQRAANQARFAFAHSPFYRELYSSHGITAADLADEGSFPHLPLVDKAHLRDNFKAIVTSQATPANSSVSKTGGSTGLPLHILRDHRFPARALEWRLFHWWGVHAWENRGIVTRHMLTGMRRRLHAIAWLPTRRVQLDAFQITDMNVTEFARRWNRLRPAVLVGYGGGVLDLVQRLQRLGLSLHPPRAIAVTAAPLLPGTRREIERALAAPVYDHYRSAEVPWIAGECHEQQGLHVFTDVRHVEILDSDDNPQRPGGEGSVIVSDLTNRVFPILRYRLGDISSLRPDPCECGRSLPRLGAISGRTSDAVRLPDGTTIAGALGHIFDAFPLSIHQFEIEQAADYAITLRCIPSPRANSDAGIADATGKLREATRGMVPITVERVGTIPQVGGKMRFIRSAAPSSPSRVP